MSKIGRVALNERLSTITSGRSERLGRDPALSDEGERLRFPGVIRDDQTPVFVGVARPRWLSAMSAVALWGNTHLCVAERILEGVSSKSAMRTM